MASSLEIFPVSPLPAATTTLFRDGVNEQQFDNGARHASTAWTKILRSWQISFNSIPRTQQQSLSAFNARFGRLRTFLMKDPYDFEIDSLEIGFTTGSNTFYIRDESGFSVIPDSADLTIVSASSGTLTQGTDYTLDQASGIVTYVLTPDGGDSWSVQTTTYFRKCAFGQNYRYVSPRVWNNFNLVLEVKEVL